MLSDVTFESALCQYFSCGEIFVQLIPKLQWFYTSQKGFVLSKKTGKNPLHHILRGNFTSPVMFKPEVVFVLPDFGGKVWPSLGLFKTSPYLTSVVRNAFLVTGWQRTQTCTQLRSLWRFKLSRNLKKILPRCFKR